MEILYLYFADPKLIFGNQDINFGGRYRFKYDSINKEFIVSENPFFIEGFFSIGNKDAANLVNVTSIIGENGAGKSSLLKLIKRTFAEGYHGIRHPLIIAVRNENNVEVYHFKGVEIKKDNLDNFNIKKIIIDGGYYDSDNEFVKTPVAIRGFLKSEFIYFSNIFDGNDDYQLSGERNLSTDYLIKNDFINDLENKILNRDSYHKVIDVHLFNDIERQINFINEYDYKNEIHFELPEYIYVTSKKEIHYDFRYSSGDSTKYLEKEDLDAFLSLEKIILSRISIKDSTTRLTDYFIGSSLLNFIDELFSHSLPITDKIKIELRIPINENSLILIDIAKYIIDDIRAQLEISNFQIERYHDWFLGVRDFINEWPNFIAGLDKSILDDSNTLRIKIDEDHGYDFRAFYQKYKNSYLLRPYLNFRWRGLSSGEKAFLNIFSRFYSLSNSQTINELKDNICILIDEGDAFLHPAWQKKFIFILINYLPKVYAKNRRGEFRKIQIILTTNSPIPASDLPNGNTIFLDKVRILNVDKTYVTKTIIRDSLNEQKETFAANIYTLLSDSFFIKDGFIGDFASVKINEVIQELTRGQKPGVNRREEIRNIIHQIGEPILKHKLMSLYNDRFNLGIHERLDDIEKRLGL